MTQIQPHQKLVLNLDFFLSQKKRTEQEARVSEYLLPYAISMVLMGTSLNVLAGESIVPAPPNQSQLPGGLFEPKVREIEQAIPDLNQYSQCSSLFRESNKSLATSKGKKGKTQKTDQVQLSADSMPVNTSDFVRLLGHVSIRSQKSLVLADEVTLDKQKGQLNASGDVSFESKEVFVRAESLTKDEEDNLIELIGTQFYFFENNANGQAQKVSVKNEDSLELEALTFSTCPIDNQSWQLSTSKMQIDQESGSGEAWDTTLKIKGVPIFYFPYLAFPIDDRRKSGLLPPGIKTSNDNGLDIKQPFYWNIAPAMDATITPRFIENRGEQLGLEYRLLTQKSYSEFGIEWMGKDKRLQSLLDDPTQSIDLDANSSKRWYGTLRNSTRFNQNWNARLSAGKTSDSNYFRDFSSGLESANATRLTSEFELNYRDSVWQMSWFAQGHQSLIGSDYYRYLPSWTAQADLVTDKGWRLQWESELTRFQHTDSQQIEGDRASLMPSLSYPMRSSWGYLTPKISYQVAWFEQENQISGESVSLSRDLPILSLDSSVYFDRQFESGGGSYTHSLEPRLLYTYIPFREQSEINVFDTRENDFNFDQLWRENRFRGIDRIGDANQLSFALGNRIINERTGSELFTFSVGKRFYLEDRQVSLLNDEVNTRSESPLLFSSSYQVTEGLSLQGEMEYDDDSGNTLRAQSGIKFEPKDNHIVNLTHRYRDLTDENNVIQKSEEIDLSFAWPVNDSWRLLGRWYNDINRGQTVEALAGIEYESCCWAVRLVAQRYLNTNLDAQGMPVATSTDEYNNGVYFQFVFNGLGSAGQSGVGRLLTSSITGYEDPFESR